jgi:hypothetical protein
VRVIIEERVREDIRLDVQGEINGLETVIEGGVGVKVPSGAMEDSEGCSTLKEGQLDTGWIKPTWACGDDHSEGQASSETTQGPQRFKLPSYSISALGLRRGS